MANEATVRNGLSITNVTTAKFNYRSPQQGFSADVSGVIGPTPGGLTVSLSGTDIDLSKLTALGGLVEIINYDLTNRVEIGIYETATGTFYPFLELLAGESTVTRLSRNATEQFDGTVTGTGTFAENNTIRAKAYGAAVSIFFGAFDP
jgi:hypothetical protein